MPYFHGTHLNPTDLGIDTKENEFSRNVPGHDGNKRDCQDTYPAPLSWLHYSPQFFGPTNNPEQLEHYEFYNPPPCDFVAASSSPSKSSPFESPPQFFLIEPSAATMSLVYENLIENRAFTEYPQSSSIMGDPTPHDQDHNHDQGHDQMQHQQIYASPSAAMSNNDPMSNDDTYAQMESALELQMEDVPQQKEGEEEASSPRAAALTKPVREIARNPEGKFPCTWNGCGEEPRSFARKCEWNKHMDKHDRPYKCDMTGCEKIPGFTYSGGLLRHQREVHNLHGGPRRQLNCPHPNCKRNSGKGFSRQENLNEHLRRVHTTSATEAEVREIQNTHRNSEETEEETTVKIGVKRKRVETESTVARDDMARVIHENETLRHQVEVQSGQIAELMRQLSDVQAILNPRMSHAPQAMM